MNLFSHLSSGATGKKQISLIFDIGSGSVGGALMELSKESKPKIIYSKRLPIKFQKNLNPEILLKNMIKAVRRVSQDLNTEGLKRLGGTSRRSKHINNVTCTLASPWFISQAKVIRVRKKEAFTISKKFIDSLIEKEEKEFKKSNLAKYSERNMGTSEIIERKFVKIKLNGYETENPYGKKAIEAEVVMFMSVAPTRVLDEVEEAIAKYFFFDDVKFNSFALVSFSAVRDMYERVKSFLLLDISAEVTDLSIIKKAAIFDMGSFPFGQNFLIREVTKSLKTVPEEALSILKLYLKGKLSKEKSSILEPVMERAKEEWLKAFQETLMELSEESYIPMTVFFMADDDLASWFGEAIKSEEFVQYTLSNEPFVVSFINSSSLNSYIDFEGGPLIDPFLGVEGVFFNKLFELEN